MVENAYKQSAIGTALITLHVSLCSLVDFKQWLIQAYKELVVTLDTSGQVYMHELF